MSRTRVKLPQGGVKIIRDLACRGARDTDIARALGVSVGVWKRLKAKDPDAAEAYEEAQLKERDALVGSLFQQAMGSPAEYDADGKLIRAERAPFAPAAMFLLKSRHNFRDMGAPTDIGGTRVAITVNVPGALSEAQYAKLVEVEAVRPNRAPSPGSPPEDSTPVALPAHMAEGADE